MSSELFGDLPIVTIQQELDAIIAANSMLDSDFIAAGSRQPFRDFWEHLWQKFKPFADKHFLSEVKRSFPQRAWEIYLGNVFLAQGHSLSSNDKGPDFVVGGSIYVECIVPRYGQENNPNTVPQIISCPIEAATWHRQPDEQLLLRLASAIKEKAEKYTGWVKNGQVDPVFPYIVAVSTGWLRYLQHRNIETLLFKGANGPGIPKRDEQGRIVSYVPCGHFMTSNFAHVSAVIFSNEIGVNFPSPIGSDCSLIINPFAKNHICDDFFHKFTILPESKMNSKVSSRLEK